jgi:3-(3-hydroxy-phenyl)propionate hydroxylase
MVKKAVRIGWAMTGGQDRAAAVRRIALAAAVRSTRLRDAMAATATPRLKTGALQPAPRRLLPRRAPAPRVGSLIPNPLLRLADGEAVRLDTLLAGRTAVLIARRPEPDLVNLCQRHGLHLIQISTGPGPDGRDGATRPGRGHIQASAGDAAQAGSGPDPADRRATPARAMWTEARLAGSEPLTVRHALTADPALAVLVRPDRVVAAVAPGRGLPRLPWTVQPEPYPPPPRAAAPDQPATTVPHPRPGQAVPPGP